MNQLTPGLFPTEFSVCVPRVIRMPVMYLLGQLWAWLASTGVNLAIIVVLALLIPRIGRFAERLVEREIAQKQNNDEQKASLAFAGVGIYIAQIVAYFLLSIAFLSELGFSLAGAAIPATVVSAAVGFGAQSIIADFLAGFFILSEKQYGVGDWVRFQGNGVEVEGSVISITMRATTIRTLAQETITIPNSTARVCVNTSNYWSRAVIVMPVPLLGSKSAAAVVDRVEAAAREILARHDIASELIGELTVQPATSVTPPATVGMPWTMDVRLMVQVEAGEQWGVERAVRMALLDEFWDEYGSATTISGELRDDVSRPASPTAFAAAGTARADVADTPDAGAETGPATSTDTTAWSAADDDNAAVTRTVTAVEPSRLSQGEGENPVPASLANPDGSDPAGDPLGDDTAPTTGAGRAAGAGGAASAASRAPEGPDRPGGPNDAAAPAAAQDPEDPEDPEDSDEMAAATTRWQRIRAAVKETRPSTLWMVGVLGLLLVVKLLTFSAEGADGERIAGIFAPPVPGSSEETTEEPAPDTPTEQPVEQEPQQPTATYQPEQPTPTTNAPGQPDPNLQAPASPTGTPEPTTDPGAGTGAGTGGGAGTPTGSADTGGDQTVQPQSGDNDAPLGDTPDTREEGALN